jgi:hypothetical protein
VMDQRQAVAVVGDPAARESISSTGVYLPNLPRKAAVAVLGRPDAHGTDRRPKKGEKTSWNTPEVTRCGLIVHGPPEYRLGLVS